MSECETVRDEIEFVDQPVSAGEAAPQAEAESAAQPEAGEPPEAEEPPAEPSIWDGAGSHLDELRRRLLVGLAVFVPLFAVGLYLYQPLWRAVILPLERAAPNLARFQALGPSDGLVMAMRMAFAFALFASLPVWLGQLWGFVAPGLTHAERRVVHLALGTGTVLFAAGAAGAYFAGIPLALEFLLPFNQSLSGWENAFTGTGYVDFVITCMAGFGIAFELPVVMAALAWGGVLTRAGLRAWWRVCVVAVFAVAAVMTPPDPFTQMLLALPMLALFAAGYGLVGWVERKR